MKTHKTNIMRGAVCGIVAFTSLASSASSQATPPPGNSPITWTTKGKPTGKMDVLYVQNAKGVTLEKGRPARLAGHLTTSSFVPLWSQGKDSFL